MKLIDMDVGLAVKYLAGTANKQEKKKIEIWLNKSAENLKQFEDFKRNRELINTAYQNYQPDPELAWYKIRSRLTSKPAKTRSIKTSNIRFLKIAAAASVLLLLGYLGRIYIDMHKYFNKDLITYNSSSEVKKIRLSDGTSVWLNSFSELRAPEKFKGEIRKVQLTGEAFFEVQKDLEHPFEIYTSGTITRVLGTSFNIRANETEETVIVSVNTGKVAFYKRNNKFKKLYLTHCEQAIYSKETRNLKKMSIDDKNFIAWKTGKLEFKKTPLPEVLETLEKLYRVNFTSDDEVHIE